METLQKPLSLLSNRELEALRRVATFAQTALGIPRSRIAHDADINPVDLDNFTKTRPNRRGETLRYKSATPSRTFQIRMIKYVTTNALLRQLSTSGTLVFEDYMMLQRKMGIATYCSDDDLVYQCLSQIGLVTDRECARICAEMAGNFYIYRYLSNPKVIFKGFLRVKKFDRYKKVPVFESFYPEIDSSITYASGIITSFNNKYYLTGGALKSLDSPLVVKGLNVIIVDGMLYAPKNKYQGIHLTLTNTGDHHFGECEMTKTYDNYNPNNIGIVQGQPRDR